MTSAGGQQDDSREGPNAPSEADDIAPGARHDPTAPMVDARTVVSYIGWFLLFSLALGFLVRARVNLLLLPSGSVMRKYDGFDGYDGVRRKSLYYEAHASEYDLVFAGDSRTYCGTDPYVIDSALGTSSFVLATFSHWLPTQYPNYQDIVAKVPRGTTVVWSIGHVNFEHVHDTEHLTYPIGVANIPRYLKWGYSWNRIGENALGLLPGLDLFAHRVSFRAKFDAVFDRLLVSPKVREARPAPDTRLADTVIAENTGAPHVINVEPIVRDGAVTSVAVLTDRGNLRRVEVDSAFHRAKQEEAAAKVIVQGKTFVGAPELWKTFLAILDLFEAHSINLVVNEFQEAPFNYRNPHNREVFDAFMSTVRKEVERRGIPYVKVDFSQLTDSDYFDYDHLNSSGIPKYSKMLSELVRPHLKKRASGAVQ